MAWTYIGGYVSGGHYNPAVSLGVAVIGRLHRKELLSYWAAQILGGIVAYAFASYLRVRIAIPQPGDGYSFGQALLVELLLAFVFVSIVLAVTKAQAFKNSHVFGFAIGFTVPALAVLGSPISGGLFNPAIALGANLFGLAKGTHVIWADVLLYVGGALAGGYLAARAFKYFVLDEER